MELGREQERELGKMKKFSAQDWIDPHARHAWELFAAASIAITGEPEQAASNADALLVEWRKRWQPDHKRETDK